MIEHTDGPQLPTHTDASAALAEQIGAELDKALGAGKKKKFVRFAMAALGSIPWVGGFMAATASFSAERDQRRINELQRQWLQEHEQKLKQLATALFEIFGRLDQFGDEAEWRVGTEEYLALVRKGFVIWDQADTEEKRTLVKRLLTNAAGTTLCSDDLVRLFLEWIDRYHEAHFAVIREIYQTPGITRGGIWDNVRGERPREDSADADLFRLLISDLSTGRVIRQHRDTTTTGEFYRKQARSGGRSSGLMKSAFDDDEPYELTGLGEQFVHYVMNDVVPRLPGQRTESD